MVLSNSYSNVSFVLYCCFCCVIRFVDDHQLCIKADDTEFSKHRFSVLFGKQKNFIFRYGLDWREPNSLAMWWGTRLQIGFFLFLFIHVLFGCLLLVKEWIAQGAFRKSSNILSGPSIQMDGTFGQNHSESLIQLILTEPPPPAELISGRSYLMYFNKINFLFKNYERRHIHPTYIFIIVGD